MVLYPVNDARVYPVGFTPLNPGKERHLGCCSMSLAAVATAAAPAGVPAATVVHIRWPVPFELNQLSVV